MKRLALLFAVLITGLATTYVCLDQAAPDPAKEKLYQDFGRWLVHSVFARPEWTKKHEGIHRFNKDIELIQAQVEQGKLTLESAIDSIHASSLENFPDFIRLVAWVEQGESTEERIARNLLRSFTERDDPTTDKKVLDRLNNELAQLLKKQNKTNFMGETPCGFLGPCG